jgi:hypothetical protein
MGGGIRDAADGGKISSTGLRLRGSTFVVDDARRRLYISFVVFPV